MPGNFHESYQQEIVEAPSERSTGLVFSAVALVIAAIFYKDQMILIASCSVAALFAVVSFLAPTLLKPLNLAWFRLSILMSKVMNPVVLMVMFMVAIVPTGLLMRLWYDPLRRYPEKALKTYWLDEDAPTDWSESMRNQF
ncbi:MAG: hypothetical protein P1U69_13740 [Parvibaculaceae bacterium]|nr:hypothetical protein [Parvibaculaceae bacterium]|tara:strand:- start:10984 stop:11403 length:420 start_codon:yes stop_codon:yes gene_type:complete